MTDYYVNDGDGGGTPDRYAYKRPVPNPVEGADPGKLTAEQIEQADKNVTAAKNALRKLQKQDLQRAVSTSLRQRQLSVNERLDKLEKYMTAVAGTIAGPMVTPSMVRSFLREELLAFTAETHHNQAAYHAVVNLAYVRSRELKVILDMFIDVLLKNGVELAPELRERLQNLEADYQRELNKAIFDALEQHHLRKLPSLQEVEARLSEA